MSEPTIRIQPVVDKRAKGVVVEQESPRYYVVSAATRVSWLEAIEAVTSFLDTQKQNGRAD